MADMKIYLVWMGEYEERHIDRAFKSKAKAEARVVALCDHPKMSDSDKLSVSIEEVEVV